MPNNGKKRVSTCSSRCTFSQVFHSVCGWIYRCGAWPQRAPVCPAVLLMIPEVHGSEAVTAGMGPRDHLPSTWPHGGCCTSCSIKNRWKYFSLPGAAPLACCRIIPHQAPCSLTRKHPKRLELQFPGAQGMLRAHSETRYTGALTGPVQS